MKSSDKFYAEEKTQPTSHLTEAVPQYLIFQGDNASVISPIRLPFLKQAWSWIQNSNRFLDDMTLLVTPPYT